MKKTLLTAALLTAFGVAVVAPQAANAASSSTINFTGKVYADTCVITVNGGAAVALPTVATSAFATTSGSALASSATNFTIALASCDTNLVSAATKFTSGSTVDSSTGNLKNSLTSNNTNVEVELLNGANVINTSTQANAPTITLSSGAGSIQLTAEYITTSTTTTAGLYSSSVGFTLTYN
jgi:major type 1 subunit fimbrin (pilin)